MDSGENKMTDDRKGDVLRFKSNVPEQKHLTSLVPRIEKASVFDMNEIVKMALKYHREDPKFRKMVSNTVMSFLYRIFGPLYVWLSLESFKAVVADRMVGYILLKHREFSIHIWDIVVYPEFQGKGIGTSLMEYAEKTAKSKFQYLTLAVLESNTAALRLYRKLGYINLQFTPITFRIEEAPTGKSSATVRLELTEGEEALSYRNKHFFNIVKSKLGFDGCKLVKLLYHPSAKLRKGIDRLKIITAEKEAGYVSVEHEKGLTSVFLLVSPDLWNTDTEAEIVETIINDVCKLPNGPVEIQVMQAYEKSLENSFEKMGLKWKRLSPRLLLVKELQRTRLADFSLR